MTVNYDNGGTLLYALIPTRVSEYIELVDNGNQATLKLKKALDFEVTKQILFSVRVSDNLGSTPDIAEFVLNVLPMNEHPPTFSPSLIFQRIVENTPYDALVATLTCTDPDVGSSGCSNMRITSGDDGIQNKFKVVGNQQIRTTNTPLDYETKMLYNLIIEATDAPPTGSVRTGTMTLVVAVDPVNEFTPSIVGQPLGRRILFSFYTIPAGNTGDVFMIMEDSGQIFTKGFLDYETTPSHSLTIRVTDGGGSSSTAVASITLENVDDNPPECSKRQLQKSIAENTTVGSKIAAIDCSDKDGSSFPLSYRIFPQDYFDITGSGDLQVKRGLVYDSGTYSHSLTVEVRDSVHTATVNVLILLTPVNDFRPNFLALSVDVREDTLIGAEIATVSVIDSDAYPDNVHQFSIVSVENGLPDSFLIDSSSGKIYLAHKLDYESTTFYRITISVDDGGVYQTDSNYLKLEQKSILYSCDLIHHREIKNSHAGFVVIPNLGCSDRDRDALSYSFNQQPSDNRFTVSPFGELKVNGVLNYEDTPFYSIEISINDGKFTTVMSIAVEIINQNEWPPTFLKSAVQVSIPENQLPRTPVVTVSAIDRDNDRLTYNFRTTYRNFLLDSNSGEIFLTTPLDREMEDVYELHVLASDGGRQSTATVMVEVIDVNEPPQFTKSNYRFSVNENTASGQTIESVTADDKDTTGDNMKLSYSIVSGNGESFFQINPNTGKLMVDSPPDYEVATEVLLVIRATDKGTPQQSEVCSVRIEIKDINDNQPMFSSSTIQIWIPEDVAVGKSVTQIFASDKDSALNGNNKMSYSSDSNVPFEIDPSSGVVTVTNDLDRETTERYEMIVIATDKGNLQLSGTLTVDVLVTDVNDNPPSVIGTYDTTIPEDFAVGIRIFSIKVQDPDDNRNFNFSILTGNIDSSFTLDPTDGYLILSSKLDRELVERYEIVIQVADVGDPSFSTSVTTTINIDDVNDVKPAFKSSSYDFSVKEHTMLATTVGKVEATDGDEGENSKLFYSIATLWTGGDGMFAINQSSGEIYTIKDLDREIESQYLLWIRVQDGGSPPFSTEITVNITVEDINDQTPVFEKQAYKASILENLAKGSKILTAKALDLDEGLNGEVIYEIDFTTQEGILAEQFFGVRSESGDIILKRQVDREVYQELTFPMIARDSGAPPRSSKVNVTIEIIDVNDNRPQFLPQFYNSEASMTDYCDAVITTVIAVDRDSEANAVISYRLNPTETDSLFQVDNFGNVKSENQLTESKYVLQIESFDGGEPPLTSLKDALVRIDTFESEMVVITFYLQLTLVTYLAMENEFIDHLQEVEKTFLKNGDLIERLQLNLNEIPTVLVEGKTWDRFQVEKVVPLGKTLLYSPPDPVTQAEEKDDLGLLLGLTFGLLAFLIISVLIVYLAWRRKWCKNRDFNFLNSSKNPRVQIIEIKSLSDKSPDDGDEMTGEHLVHELLNVNLIQSSSDLGWLVKYKE
uniref:Protocadherin Fat 4 n=1 Tax=Magallana gigas TaxID=29159 RepID=K1Q2F1_MAGGI